jgi:uncharacterized membrane protein YfcA
VFVDPANLITYLALGAGAGVIAGLLGVGGGLIIVPVLALVFHGARMPESVIMHLAIGTSLATIVMTSSASVFTHHRHGTVMWRVFVWIAPGIILGAMLGSGLAARLHSDNLKLIFGIFELVIALQLLLDVKPRASRRLAGPTGLGAAGGVIGFISALLGIGGGTMTVPFLVWCNVSIHQAVGTSAAVGLSIALAGALGYVVTGLNDAAVPAHSLGYVYWPALLCIAAASLLAAPLGATLAYHLPTTVLKRLFALLLAGLGIWMLRG